VVVARVAQAKVAALRSEGSVGLAGPAAERIVEELLGDLAAGPGGLDGAALEVGVEIGDLWRRSGAGRRRLGPRYLGDRAAVGQDRVDVADVRRRSSLEEADKGDDGLVGIALEDSRPVAGVSD
jgi:hypothetical protein